MIEESRKFYEEIAVLMPDWKQTFETFDTYYDNTHCNVYMDQPDEARFSLRIQGERITAYALLPQYAGYISLPYGETSPRITVAISRGAETVVKELARRFLPEFWRLHKLCWDTVRTARADDARQEAWAVQLEEQFGAKRKLYTGGPGRDPELYLKIGEIDFEIRIGTHKISTEVHYLTMGQFKALLTELQRLRLAA